MTNKVFLIRHAESEANVGIPQKYVHNIVITENGRQQAKELAEILEKPDRIIVSKFIRTIEIAEPTIKKFPEVEVHLWPDIHEFEPLVGVKDLPLEEQRKINDEYWSNLEPHYKMSQEIESFSEFVDRVMQVRRKVSLINGKNYIFTHGYIVRLFILMMKNPELFKDINDLNYGQIMREFIEINKVFKSQNTGVYDITSIL